MHLLFVKLHLIIFEIVSLVLLCLVFAALFYYSVIFKNYPSMEDPNNIGIQQVYFTASIKEKVFADSKITLFPNSTPEKDLPEKHKSAYILYSKPYFKDSVNDSARINTINEADPSNIFLFEDESIANNFKSYIINLQTECSTFNLTLFLLISLFLIFMKITLLKDSFYRLKKIKSSKSDGKNEVYTNLLRQINPEEDILSEQQEEAPKNLYYNPVLSFLNPINVYYYVIFHLTIVIIIPSIFPNFIEYYVISYFGFMADMSYSVFYSRSYFGLDFFNKNKIDLDYYMITKNPEQLYPEKHFILHNYIDVGTSTPININPYMINLLVICASIWLSQLFHPFSNPSSVKIVDVDLKRGKLKRYIKFATVIGVFLIWGFLIVRGLIYLIDNLYLFHRLLAYNFIRFLDVKIPLLIALFYYHLIFYGIMGIYTFQTYKKNKKYEGNQKIIYNWFS